MAACGWNTQAIKGRMCKMCFCRRGHGSAARERQVSVWCFDYWLWKFLPLSSRRGRLYSSQPLIICPLPIVMCSLYPSLDSSVYTSAPYLSSLSLLCLSPYYEKEEGKDKGGGKCKYRSFFCDTSGLITPTSVGSGRSPLYFSSPLARLHYIMKSFTSSKPSSAPGAGENTENSQVTKEESLAAGHEICFADEAGQE